MACGKIVEAIVPVPNGENILVDQPLVVKTLYKAEGSLLPFRGACILQRTVFILHPGHGGRTEAHHQAPGVKDLSHNHGIGVVLAVSVGILLFKGPEYLIEFVKVCGNVQAHLVQPVLPDSGYPAAAWLVQAGDAVALAVHQEFLIDVVIGDHGFNGIAFRVLQVIIQRKNRAVAGVADIIHRAVVHGDYIDDLAGSQHGVYLGSLLVPGGGNKLQLGVGALLEL